MEMNEQLIELIISLRPLATTDPDAVRVILSNEKLAQEAVKIMSVLGIIDADALSNALAKMVPNYEQKAPSNGMSHTQVVAPIAAPFPTQAYQPPVIPAYDARALFNPTPTNSWADPRQNIVNQPPPIVGSALPTFAQNLSSEEQAMLITALAMSPAELDRLPPQQRAVFMQLRQMMPGI